MSKFSLCQFCRKFSCHCRFDKIIIFVKKITHAIDKNQSYVFYDRGNCLFVILKINNCLFKIDLFKKVETKFNKEKSSSIDTYISLATKKKILFEKFRACSVVADNKHVKVNYILKDVYGVVKQLHGFKISYKNSNLRYWTYPLKEYFSSLIPLAKFDMISTDNTLRPKLFLSYFKLLKTILEMHEKGVAHCNLTPNSLYVCGESLLIGNLENCFIKDDSNHNFSCSNRYSSKSLLEKSSQALSKNFIDDAFLYLKINDLVSWAISLHEMFFKNMPFTEKDGYLIINNQNTNDYFPGFLIDFMNDIFICCNPNLGVNEVSEKYNNLLEFIDALSTVKNSVDNMVKDYELIIESGTKNSPVIIGRDLHRRLREIIRYDDLFEFVLFNSNSRGYIESSGVLFTAYKVDKLVDLKLFFKVGLPIASGSAGQVYRLIDPVSHESLALKITSNDYIPLTEKEIELVNFIYDHTDPKGLRIQANLINTFICSNKKSVAYSTLLYDGDLVDLISQNVVYDYAGFMGNLFVQLKKILLTLLNLHAAGIAHCDVKPENILYKTANDKAELFLADFGGALSLAHLKHFTNDENSIWRSTAHSPLYSSKNLTEASKIFLQHNNYEGVVAVSKLNDLVGWAITFHEVFYKVLPFKLNSSTYPAYPIITPENVNYKELTEGLNSLFKEIYASSARPSCTDLLTGYKNNYDNLVLHVKYLIDEKLFGFKTA